MKTYVWTFGVLTMTVSFLLLNPDLVYAKTSAFESCEDLLALNLPPALRAHETPSIHLKVKVGAEESLFYRGGADNLTTVQVRAVSGERPLVGGFFPAGNSGAMMMLKAQKPVQLTIQDDAFAVQAGADRGITSTVHASNLDQIESRHTLDIQSFILGSVRFLRDHVVADHGTWVEYGMKPAEIQETITRLESGDLLISRISLSGKARYTMRLHPLGATVSQTPEGVWRFTGGATDGLDFQVTMTTSELPRVGMKAQQIIKPEYLQRMTDEEIQKIEFLFYEDGAVAGAHAYMTYFGRDPLITAMIAQDAFTKEALKIVLAAALDTVDATGNVAHEPEMGERASLTRKQRGELSQGGFYDDTMIYDYAMVDTQFLAAPVAELLLREMGPREFQSFLAQRSRSASGRTYAEQLTLNKNRILKETRAFALAEMSRPGDRPDPVNYKLLIHLLEGRSTGQWRDSDFGIAGGRTPFETNTVLVPAALRALLKLYELELPGWPSTEIKTVQENHAQWAVKPYAYFEVTLSNAEARLRATAYAQKLGLNLPDKDPLHGQPMTFYAVALDQEGHPIPVVHSDMSFAMLYTDPPANVLSIMLKTLSLPYPYGLDSPAGIFVASPAFASPEIQARFKLNAYHAGIWSMQQEMEARGLKRQTARTDLPAEIKRQIRSTYFKVWRAIVRNFDWRPVELWSAEVKNGQIERLPFGVGSNIVAEACLNQFWSNTKIANFAPPGWDQIPAAQLLNFLSWGGKSCLKHSL